MLGELLIIWDLVTVDVTMLLENDLSDQGRQIFFRIHLKEFLEGAQSHPRLTSDLSPKIFGKNEYFALMT